MAGLYLSGFLWNFPLVGKIRRPMVWLAGGGLATVIVASSAVGVGIWRSRPEHL